jgi:hypothetical protein
MATATPLRSTKYSAHDGRWMAHQIGAPFRRQHYVEEVSKGSRVYDSTNWLHIGYRAVCGCTVIEADENYLARLPQCPVCASFCKTTRRV